MDRDDVFCQFPNNVNSVPRPIYLISLENVPLPRRIQPSNIALHQLLVFDSQDEVFYCHMPIENNPETMARILYENGNIPMITIQLRPEAGREMWQIACQCWAEKMDSAEDQDFLRHFCKVPGIE